MCNDVNLVFQLSRQYNIIFITYLLKPGETTVFCRPSTALVVAYRLNVKNNTFILLPTMLM